MKKCVLSALCTFVVASSFAQVMTPPYLMLVGGESTPFGQLSSLLVRVLPNSPGINGRSLLSINGVTEYYHLSNLAPLSKIFPRTLIPLRSGETLGPLQPDFEGHSPSPGDQPNPSEFVFRVSSVYNGASGDSLALYKNGVIRYIARLGTTLNGKVVVGVSDVRPSGGGDAVFTVSMQGGGRRLYLYRRSLASLTILTQSDKTMPDGRVLGATPIFQASVDDVAKRVFFMISETPLANAVYSCKFNGTDLKLEASNTTLVPGSTKNIMVLQHAQNNTAYIQAGDLASDSTFYAVQNQKAQPILGVGVPLAPGQPNSVQSFDGLASSANGVWHCGLINTFVPGEGQLVARPNPSSSFSGTFLGPASGTIYTDSATGRLFILEKFIDSSNISDSGDIQFLARVKMLDTGLSSVAILRTHPDIF